MTSGLLLLKNLLDVNLGRRRQKLERALDRPPIKTIRGLGFQFV